MNVLTSKALRVALALALSASIVGCGLLKKKKKTDPGDEDEPPVTNAPTVTVTGTGAKNEASVLRYAKETKLSDEPGTIGKDVTKVLEFPQTGKHVATLNVGTPVTKIAKYFSTGVLILFEDPVARDGTKLMGWVDPTALLAPTAAATATATATAVATGAGTAPKATAAATTAVDAGAKAADAGAPGKDAADAGAKTADAGAPTTPPPQIQVLPTAGKCPAGFELMGPFCRKPCSTDAQCPKGTFCTFGAAGKKSCSATK